MVFESRCEYCEHGKLHKKRKDKLGKRSPLYGDTKSKCYSYDAGGRLRELRHHDRNKTLARFLYQVDERGNRTQAFEELARPSTIVQTIGISDAAVSYYKGTWTTSGSYKQTTQFSSAMTITFTGKESTLTLGTGTDHAIFDIYIDGSLWESFDGYSASGIDRTINIYLDKRLDQTDAHVIDIRNRAEKNKNSTGYTLRFKQLTILNTVYDQQTINYGYDALARLLTASYAGVSPTRSYAYAFDRNGNRTQQVVTVGGTPTTTNYTYNAVNQLTSGGATYDNNGNLTSDGTNSYTWDRANRLLSMGGASYKYDGLNNRVQQTVGANITKYLLDLQPGLAVVLSETTGANVIRNVHAPRGIHAHKDAAGAWEWMVQDGLGSVRGVVDNTVGVLESRNYDPYGELFDVTGNSQTNFGFTGEPMDENGLLYLRARYYNPAAGVFTALDPFEGVSGRPMSLNGYSWVEGNVPNKVDPTGMAIVDIWIAAFISPSTITFPYPFTENDTGNLVDFAVDVNATWLGDGRGFYSGSGDYPVQNSRVWYLIEFDTNNPSQLSSNSNKGAHSSTVTYTDYSQGVQNTVTKPTIQPAPIGYVYRTDGHIRTSVNESSSNPLVSVAPPINLTYAFLFDLCGGTVTYTYLHDVFPWHEMVLSVDGAAILFQNDPPVNPLGIFGQSPANLGLNPFNIQYQGTYGPLYIPQLQATCKTGMMEREILKYIPNGINLPCI